MSAVAVFWDRDNTLIRDPGYLSDPGQVELLPGAAEAIQRLAAAGFENIIVTNQSGVARGMFDEAALERVHDRLVALCAEQGAKIDAIYYCPYLPGDEAKVEKYRRDSELRKPKPGMILQASLERKLEPAGSWMIGDALRDCQAGRAAGCRTILVRWPGAGGSGRKGGDVDFVVDSLEQAAATVLRYTRHTGGTPPSSAAPAQPAGGAARAVSSPEKVESKPMQTEPTTVKKSGSPGTSRPEPVTPVRLDLSDTPVAIEPTEAPAPSTPHGQAHLESGPGPERTSKVRAPSASRDDDAPARQTQPATQEPRGLASTRVRAEPSPAADTNAILQEILAFMRTVDRRARAEDFALGKLLGVIVQIVAVGAMVWALFGFMRSEPIEARLGFAILFQLMALTAFASTGKK